MLRFFRFRPEGAAISQPRATPWVGVTSKLSWSPEGAQHSPCPCLFRPYRASDVRFVLLPRALPWADLFALSGPSHQLAFRRKAQLQHEEAAARSAPRLRVGLRCDTLSDPSSTVAL